MEEVDSQWVSHYLKEKGFKNTSKWIMFALKSRIPDFWKDVQDVLDSMRAEVRDYRQEHYRDPVLKEAYFDSIQKVILDGMTVGPSRFGRLTTELVPIVQEMIEANKLLEDIAGIAGRLEDKPRFYMICFYYLILYEGSYKNVRRQLLAMKRLKEGKNVRITETLEVVSEDEKDGGNLKDILPNYLKVGIHQNLRNAIAHTHFRYLQEKKEMEFWDICPRGWYSLKPRKLSYQEFSKYLLDVNLFCEIYGFLILLLIALSDIAKHR